MQDHETARRSPFSNLATRLGRPLGEIEEAARRDQLDAYIAAAEPDERRHIEAARASTAARVRAETAASVRSARQSRTSDPRIANEILEAKRQPS